MPAIAYVNGEFLPLEEAKVSIEDRGFQFGDGVYEVIRVYRGHAFRLRDHLMRLIQSAQGISLPLPLTTEEWETNIREGLKRCGYPECKVYIQLTRGTAPRDHLFPGNVRPTIVMTFREAQGLPDDYYLHGVSVMTTPDLRWAKCFIKSLNLLPNVLAKQAANEMGAMEAILIKNGCVTEGTASNVVLVKEEKLITPALSDQLLAGVTRRAILDLVRKKGIVVEERSVRQEELKQADELFLIGTTIEVLPVVKVNGEMVGNGVPGKLTTQIMEDFRTFIRENVLQGTV